MNLALPTGVAAGVARLFLGWQLPPHATPVDPPLVGPTPLRQGMSIGYNEWQYITRRS